MATSEKILYETIIRQVKGEDTFVIRTSNRKLKNRFAAYDIEPDDESGTTQVFEEVPGNWLRIQRPRQFTEEELEETRARLSKSLGRDKPMTAAQKKKAAAAAAAKKKKVEEPEEDNEEDDDEDEVTTKRKSKTSSKSAAATSKAKGKSKVDEDDDDEVDDDDDDDDEDEPVEVVKRKKTRK